MRTTPARRRGSTLLPPHGAIVWLDRGRALVTREDQVGGLHVHEFTIGEPTEERPAPYAQVVHALLDADAIVVLGEADARTDLERAYVSIVKHPERLHEPVRDGREVPA